MLGSSCSSRDRYPWLTVHQLRDMRKLGLKLHAFLERRLLLGWFHWLCVMLHF